MAGLSTIRPIGRAFAGMVLLAVAAGLTACGPPPSAPTDRRLDDQEAITGAKAALVTRMTAAQTVSFGPVSVHWRDDVPSVCGQVDIQEDQDEFGGAERFISSQGALFIEEIDGDAVLDQKWAALCQ